jgi:hypothetical protein
MSGKYSKDKNPRVLEVPLAMAAAASNKARIASAPSPRDVAKAAYFKYLNEGSVAGRDEKHWLEAEAQLRGEVGRLHNLDS